MQSRTKLKEKPINKPICNVYSNKNATKNFSITNAVITGLEKPFTAKKKGKIPTKKELSNEQKKRKKIETKPQFNKEFLLS
jgi:hypothetical protein